MKRQTKARARLQQIKDLLAGSRTLLIVMQDNPDPDSIAAAVALRRLVNSLSDVQCSITHGGRVGRAENRALVKYLGLNLRPAADIDFSKFDLRAIVDAQPGTGNNCFPEGIVPDIVIDHHPVHKRTRSSPVTDIRQRYGATSTILFEYLTEAGLTIEVPIATALFYGIRSDTQDLGRGATKADIDAISRLYTTANMRMLGEIQRGRVRREYYGAITRALSNAKVYDNCIISSLGDLVVPDMVGEVADLLLRDDTTEWVLCYGWFDGQMLLSVRTSSTEISAEKAMKKVVSRKGTGGGHETMAGGQIVLKKGTKKESASLEKLVRRRFIKAVGADSNYGVALVRPAG